MPTGATQPLENVNGLRTLRLMASEKKRGGCQLNVRTDVVHGPVWYVRVTLTRSERIDPHAFFHETVQFGHCSNSLLAPTQTRSDIRDFLKKRLDVLWTGRNKVIVRLGSQFFFIRGAYRAMSQ